VEVHVALNKIFPFTFLDGFDLNQQLTNLGNHEA
jgi:hypothetical protein